MQRPHLKVLRRKEAGSASNGGELILDGSEKKGPIKNRIALRSSAGSLPSSPGMYQRAGIEVDGLRARRENPSKVFVWKRATRWWPPSCLGVCGAPPHADRARAPPNAPASASAVDERAEKALRSAARLGDVGGVRTAAMRANVNCTTPTDETALHIAAGEGTYPILSHLIPSDFILSHLISSDPI